MTEWQEDAVRWGSVRIGYRYRYSSRRTLAISVHPDLSVTVKAPLGVPPDRIRRAVLRRGAWIEKSRQDRELYLPKQPPRRYLIKAPKECIDHVILHELCHLKERHHGPRYWALLRQLIPNWVEVRSRLNQLACQ